MPVSFTPDLVPRFDATFLSYINTNMQRLKQALSGVAKETISTTAPSSPYTGQRYTNTSLGIDYIYNGTAWVPVSHWGAGTLHTPVWGQPGALTKTTDYSNYFKEGRKITGGMKLTCGQIGNANTEQTVTVPVAPSFAGNRAVGNGNYYDVSLNVNIPLTVYLASSTLFKFIVSSTNQLASFGAAGSGHAEATAVNDVISFEYKYESAS